MDLQLAKTLSKFDGIGGFNVYRDVDTCEWFFYVITKHTQPDDDGEPFKTAKSKLKRYKSLDTLMAEIFSILDEDDAGRSRPINVHYS